jgi:hypothetical protein
VGSTEIPKPAPPHSLGLPTGLLSLKGFSVDDLHLERLKFVQQLFELEEAFPFLYRQRIEVNFIRLIEQRQQEN